MGGHGGLNILPQKRWNVYNFDNREKVKKDEEAAAEEERKVADEQRRRDGEVRRELLLARAKQRRAELLPDAGAPAALLAPTDEFPSLAAAAHVSPSVESEVTPAEPALPLRPPAGEPGEIFAKQRLCGQTKGTKAASEVEDLGRGDGTRPGASPAQLVDRERRDAESSGQADVAGGVSGSTKGADILDSESAKAHFNLFEQEERRLLTPSSVGHPGGQNGSCTRGFGSTSGTPSTKRGREAEEKEANGEDVRYSLGYGASRPWYAQSSRELGVLKACDTEATIAATAANFGLASKQAKVVAEPGGIRDEEDSRHHRKKKSKRKEGKKNKETKVQKHSEEHRLLEEKARALEKLRQQRIEREQKEKLRASKLLAQHGHSTSAVQPAGTGAQKSGHIANSRGYNSGYGYGR